MRFLCVPRGTLGGWAPGHFQGRLQTSPCRCWGWLAASEPFCFPLPGCAGAGTVRARVGDRQGAGGWGSTQQAGLPDVPAQARGPSSSSSWAHMGQTWAQAEGRSRLSQHGQLGTFLFRSLPHEPQRPLLPGCRAPTPLPAVQCPLVPHLGTGASPAGQGRAPSRVRRKPQTDPSNKATTGASPVCERRAPSLCPPL